MFIMGGYQASFQFNLTDLLQVQGDHIASVIDYVPQQRLRHRRRQAGQPKNGGSRK